VIYKSSNISLNHIHAEEKGILFYPYFILAENYLNKIGAVIIFI